MAHNTRPLKRAQDGVAPQYYNPTTDEYEALHGTAGANHVVIYGPDGQPAALATEAKLEAARALLESLDGKDFASETTLAAMETELGLAKTELAAIKGMLTDGTAKGEVTLSGNIAELSSAQYAEPATTVKTYTRAVGATRIEVYVETGRVRIRTDGQPCTAVTGEPLGEGFGAAWAAPSISVLFVSDAVITVVSR